MHVRNLRAVAELRLALDDELAQSGACQDAAERCPGQPAPHGDDV